MITAPDTRITTDRSTNPGFRGTPLLVRFLRGPFQWTCDPNPANGFCDLGAGFGMPVAKELARLYPQARVDAVDLQFCVPGNETWGMPAPNGGIGMYQSMAHALARKHRQQDRYGVICASNVLNVQRSREELEELILDVRKRLFVGGLFVANYPEDPRGPGLPSTTALDALLREYFTEVQRFRQVKNTWLQVPEELIGSAAPRQFQRRPIFLARV